MTFAFFIPPPSFYFHPSDGSDGGPPLRWWEVLLALFLGALPILILLAMAALSGCESTTLSPRACPAYCYDGPSNTRDVGPCHAGTPVCDAKGNITSCAGQIIPQLELCGATEDVDCSGSVDWKNDPDVGVRCWTGVTGACGPGWRMCVNGQLACVPTLGVTDEVCDGVDNDCDGRVDNVAPELCYTGDLRELLSPMGRCRAGIVECANDHTPVCVGERRPTPEVCSNMVDDDCDGFIDNIATSTSSEGTDVVLIVDLSGSMSMYIDAVRNGLVDFIDTEAAPDTRFALITLAPNSAATSTVVSDFVSPLVARQLVYSLMISNGAIEPSYDVLVDIGHDAYHFSWRAKSRKLIIFFGDEEGQSERGLTDNDSAVALESAGISFYGFVYWTYRFTYVETANRTFGRTFDIQLPPSQFELLLPSIITSTCAG